MGEEKQKIQRTVYVSAAQDESIGAVADQCRESMSAVMSAALEVGLAALQKGAGKDLAARRVSAMGMVDGGRMMGSGWELEPLVEGFDARLDELKAGVIANLAAQCCLMRTLMVSSNLRDDDMGGCVNAFTSPNGFAVMFDMFARIGFGSLSREWRIVPALIAAARAGEIDVRWFGFDDVEQFASMLSVQEETIDSRRSRSSVKVSDAAALAGGVLS